CQRKGQEIDERFGEKRRENLETLGSVKRPQSAKNTVNGKLNRNARGLKGVAYEKAQTLYLESIEVEADDSDDDIENLVKEHVKYLGIRIMKLYVVRNRYSEYRVGVKLIVPETSVTKAMDPDVWPHPITCRRWERRSNSYGRRIPSHVTYRSRQRQIDEDDFPPYDNESNDGNDSDFHKNLCEATRDYVNRNFNLRATGYNQR
ncbi:unnamed protein product, partial [Owenia fusiformis]